VHHWVILSTGVLSREYVVLEYWSTRSTLEQSTRYQVLYLVPVQGMHTMLQLYSGVDMYVAHTMYSITLYIFGVHGMKTTMVPGTVPLLQGL
jgi:uncharacterized membrane protein